AAALRLPRVRREERELRDQADDLAPDFSSDATVWSSKTGTLLNLRHETGVVEHADGQAFAVTALTESHLVRPCRARRPSPLRGPP
ncbi:serine hydrolase, partial [Streptomyces massasporeus]